MKKNKGEYLPVFRPDYGREEIKAVSDVLLSGWSGLGPKTEEFENKFANYVGVDYAIALNSATAALHLALLVAGVGQGDEVIVPSLTFVSTAHAVTYTGAKPVFADIDPNSLCITPYDIIKKITRKTKAIIPVHYGGNPCEMDMIGEITKIFHLTVIEDAAHACGSVYNGKRIGSISPLTCFSFHAVKNLSTGDGGMITTNDKTYAEKLKRLRWMGITKDTWKRLESVSSSPKQSAGYGWFYEVTELGYKCHMNDITAAIGLVQLSKLEKANAIRRKLANNYTDKLSKISGIELPVATINTVSAQHNYVIKTKDRDSLHLYLRDNKISTGVHYMPVHLHPFYREMYPNLELSETDLVWNRLLTLPLFPTLKSVDQNIVINLINKFFDNK